MPEGDTIFRAARTLEKVLAGKQVRRFHSTVPGIIGADLESRRVERVAPHGKNLLIHFDDGRALYTHLRMTGSWHIYRPGEAWQRPAHRARVIIEVDDFVAVCFSAPVVELLAPGAARRHPTLSRLGPDLLADDFDAEAARKNLRERGDAPIGEAIMVQRALAGIGNVYKSEALFLCGCDPFTPVERLPEAMIARIIEQARSLMKDNLQGFPRTTRKELGGKRVWVYGRRGERCYRCGETIRMRRQGLAGRSTYWCPGCQPARG